MFFFFFNDTATTEIYTLSLHDALPILANGGPSGWQRISVREAKETEVRQGNAKVVGSGIAIQDPLRMPVREAQVSRIRTGDRKSTRLNSSHANISYAVFCLKKKKKI